MTPHAAILFWASLPDAANLSCTIKDSTGLRSGKTKIDMRAKTGESL
jgi:hypothetical protein